MENFGFGYCSTFFCIRLFMGGSCNGTRLVVRGFQRNTIDAEIMVDIMPEKESSYHGFRYAPRMMRFSRSNLRGSSFLLDSALP